MNIKYIILLCGIIFSSHLLGSDNIKEELTKLLKDPELKIEIAYRTERGDDFMTSKSRCDYSYIWKKLNSKEVVASFNKPIPCYNIISTVLSEFSYILISGKRFPLDKKDILPLLKAISKTKIKQVVEGVGDDPDAGNKYIRKLDIFYLLNGYPMRGLCVVLSKGEKPFFVFDVVSPEYLYPDGYDNNNKIGYFYKVYVDKKGRLYMFDSFVYPFNDRIELLSAYLWRKLDVKVVIMKKMDSQVHVEDVADYSFVPKAAVKDKKLVSPYNFAVLYTQIEFNNSIAYRKKWEKELADAKKKIKNKDLDEEERKEVEELITRNESILAQGFSEDFNKEIEEFKKEAKKRKQLYDKLLKNFTP